MFDSDNGASSEFINRSDKHTTGSVPGSQESFLCLGSGWACTANTQMRYSKANTFEGGIATPFIAHWPAGIKDNNAIRTTAAHLIEILPTVTSLAGGLKGELVSSQAPLFPSRDLTDSYVSDAPTERDLLIFSHIGDSLRVGDWQLVRLPKGERELYKMNGDRSETKNVAAKYPEKLQQMSQLFDKTNAAYKVKASAEVPKAKPKSKKASDSEIPKNAKKPYLFYERNFVRLEMPPALTLENDVTWELEMIIGFYAAPQSILIGNRDIPGHKKTFFKVPLEHGVQMYKDGGALLRIPDKFSRGKWVQIRVKKKGKDFSVFCDEKEIGSAVFKEVEPRRSAIWAAIRSAEGGPGAKSEQHQSYTRTSKFNRNNN